MQYYARLALRPLPAPRAPALPRGVPDPPELHALTAANERRDPARSLAVKSALAFNAVFRLVRDRKAGADAALVRQSSQLSMRVRWRADGQNSECGWPH